MWKILTIDDLRLILAENEIQALDTVNKDGSIEAMVNQQILLVSEMWRGALRKKGYVVDVRPGYVPAEYWLPILQHARWVSWSRFPFADNYALSEPRKFEFEEAMKLLKEVDIGPSAPDYSNLTPEEEEQYGDLIDQQKTDGAVSMPFLKFPPWPGDQGFAQIWKGFFPACGCHFPH